MQTLEITVAKRDLNVTPRNLRREGLVPGVIYGGGGDSVPLSLNARDYSKNEASRHAGAHLIALKSDDSEIDGAVALIKAVQCHPVSGVPTHIDFLRLDMSEPVTARVPLHFTGKPAGATEGGMLSPIRRELDVRALPTSLPEQVDVDVSALNIHDSIHVADLTLPEGVEAIFVENFTLCTVVPPTVDKAADAEEAAEAEAAPAAAAES